MNTQRAWTKELRDKALALLPNEAAWMKFAYGRAGGRYGTRVHPCDAACDCRCAVGVVIATLGLPDLELTHDKIVLEHEMMVHLGWDMGSLMAWNDNPKRRFEEVRRAFETVPIREDE